MDILDHVLMMSFSREPTHGYVAIKRASKLLGYDVPTPTGYRRISEMEKIQLIESVEPDQTQESKGPSRKPYLLTAKGEEIYREGTKILEDVLNVIYSDDFDKAISYV